MRLEQVCLFYLGILSSILLALSFPPFNLSFLIWIAFIPLFLAIHLSVSPSKAATLGAICGIAFYSFCLHWFFRIFGIIGISFIFILALFVSFFSWILKFIDQEYKLYNLGGLILVPVVWTGLEFFRSECWWLEFSWLSLGFSQWNNLEILQIASILGIYGLSFLIILVNGLIFSIIFKKRWFLGVIVLLLFLGMFVWGKKQIKLKDKKGEIEVALIQNESFDKTQLIQLTKEVASKKPKFILWPEYSVVVLKNWPKKSIEFLLELAREVNSYLIVGCFEPHLNEGKHKNYALVVSPRGKIIGRYQKMHPVQFLEKNVQPGKKCEAFKTEYGKIGVGICYDMDYVNVTYNLVKAGAEIIFVPNLDLISWGRWQHQQHSAMIPLRAVESRRWIVRAASSGTSMIVNPVGRIQKQLGFAKVGTLNGKICFTKRKSIYHRYGWFFPHFNLGLLFSFLIYLVIKYKLFLSLPVQNIS